MGDPLLCCHFYVRNSPVYKCASEDQKNHFLESDSVFLWCRLKIQLLELLASDKWSLLSLPVPSTLVMDFNGKIEILQKGESCGCVGLIFSFSGMSVGLKSGLHLGQCLLCFPLGIY